MMGKFRIMIKGKLIFRAMTSVPEKTIKDQAILTPTTFIHTTIINLKGWE
jgi:hypothetical protein